MKKLLQAIFLLAAYTVFAQSCPCEENFKWVKRTFEENDAGFMYVIDKKGYYLDDTIPNHGWVEYTEKTFSSKK